MSETGTNIKQLARNIKEDPNDSFSKFALALEFLKQENLKRAKILFEDIYKNDPDYTGVYYHLGKLYERLGSHDKALIVFKEGINLANKQDKTRTEKELQEACVQLEAEIDK